MVQRKRRAIKVVDKKMWRRNGKRLMGLCFFGSHIEIDPRLTSRKYLSTLIHEALHYCFPTASETKVSRSAYSICRVIWEKNYRRISG